MKCNELLLEESTKGGQNGFLFVWKTIFRDKIEKFIIFWAFCVWAKKNELREIFGILVKTALDMSTETFDRELIFRSFFYCFRRMVEKFLAFWPKSFGVLVKTAVYLSEGLFWKTVLIQYFQTVSPNYCKLMQKKSTHFSKLQF